MGKTFRRDSDYGRKFAGARRSNKQNSHKKKSGNSIDSPSREGYSDPAER